MASSKKEGKKSRQPAKNRYIQNLNQKTTSRKQTSIQGSEKYYYYFSFDDTQKIQAKRQF